VAGISRVDEEQDEEEYNTFMMHDLISNVQRAQLYSRINVKKLNDPIGRQLS
jgi:hypothetical protein